LLPLYIEELLAYAKEQQLIIEAVALSEGPGSYTGLRIGTATAKGLCYGWNIPLIPIPTLEVLCEAARTSTSRDLDISKGILIPMIDARRMEVYTKVTGYGLPVMGTRAVVVENEESLTNDQSPITNDQSVYYFGDGAAKCQSVLTAPNWHFIPDIVPEAQYMGVLAENSKSIVKGTDLAYFEPFYLKEFIAAPSHVKGLK
jgi:tRNA threonylcarbamoyladenosine biosynthesis protein TsaB